MSAFIVTERHINYLVNAALSPAMCPRGLQWSWFGFRPHWSHVETACALGQLLWEENRKSVNYRYNKSSDLPQYRFEPVFDLEPVQVLKAIECYEHQACEPSDWETSPAREFCDALRRAVITALPGYEAALWELVA